MMLNYFALYWCDLEGETWLFAILAGLVLLVLFKYIMITVEEHVSLGIHNIAVWTEFSDGLSAVTLLALANGIGDVLTSIIAGQSEEGISYSIGMLYGAGLFACSFILALCILREGVIILDKATVFRSVGMYIGATFIILGLALYQKIHWWGSVILLMWYVLLLGIVIVQDSHPVIAVQEEESRKSQNKDNAVIGGESGKSEQSEVEEKAMERILDGIGTDNELDRQIGSRQPGEDVVDLRPIAKTKEQSLQDIDSEDRAEVAQIFGPLIYSVNESKRHFEKAEVSPSNQHVMRGVLYKLRSFNLAAELHRKLEMIRETRKGRVYSPSFVDQVLRFIEAPFIAVLYLTVLPCDVDQYSRKRCLMYPFPAMLFTTWVFLREVSVKLFVIAFVLALPIQIFFWFTLTSERPTKYFPLMNAFGVAGALVWTYVLVSILIDEIECLGVLLNLDRTYLGLTVLAMGNSTTDVLTTLSLSKQGESSLAISGSYSGQLFGLLVGFGISTLRNILQYGPQKFNLLDPHDISENIQGLLVIGTTLIVLFSTLIYSAFNHYTLTKRFGYYLLSIYAIFLIGTTIVAVYNAVK